jgi:glyoxylase-like metal-dependent hydrolase (beta-lactamase superfamily II)
VPAVEWAFWADEANASKANGFNKPNFPNVKKAFDGLADKVTKFEWDKEVAPGITAIGAPGHTPGHTAFAVQSGSGKLLVQSDVTNIPALFVRNPDWHVAFDNDPAMAQATRHKFYDMAAAEKAPVAGYHFSFPSVGHVEKDGKGYRLVPVAVAAVDLICANKIRGNAMMNLTRRAALFGATATAVIPALATTSGARRSPGCRQAGARLLSLQDRRHRSDRGDGWCRAGQANAEFRHQREGRRGQGRSCGGPQGSGDLRQHLHAGCAQHGR